MKKLTSRRKTSTEQIILNTQ